MSRGKTELSACLHGLMIFVLPDSRCLLGVRVHARVLLEFWY